MRTGELSERAKRAVGFTFVSISFGGEIRDVKKPQALAILGVVFVD